jgi:uncharacterized protein
MEIIFLIFIMLLAGSLAGLLAGLFGIGGGLVVVPTLLYVFNMMGVNPEATVHLAIGTSLSTVIITTFRATQAHAKKNSVDFDLVKSYSVPTIIGSALGVFGGVRLGAKTVIIMFAIFLFILSFKFIFPKLLDGVSLGEEIPQGFLKYVLGLLLGACSALFGIGGGSLVVTVMSLYKRSIHQAIGTASAFGIVISIVGCISSIFAGWSAEGLPFASLGYVNLIGFAGIVISSSFIAPLGAKLAHKLDQVLLKKIFGVYLMLTAIKLIVGSL